MSSALLEACAAMKAFRSGRVSLTYDEPEISLSVTAKSEGAWFWCIYDRKKNKIQGFGNSTSAQAAVDAALRLLRIPDPGAGS